MTNVRTQVYAANERFPTNFPQTYLRLVHREKDFKAHHRDLILETIRINPIYVVTNRD